jgi:dual specificity tyrosine-phosphorylation-regulated kinase 1
MLSLNLYELLKNTQFGGVSLNLIRKFAKQVLKTLSFLSREDVDIIHCDLKPENILLRHPKKSAVKVIDFGSSCRSNRRMYSYIQSRFYRSPEVMLGQPYTTAIDMWSLGCILVEMHTGEPLFSGSDQFDQMQKIVKILGMVPQEMLSRSTEQNKQQFFQRSTRLGTDREWEIRQTKPPSSKDAGTDQPRPAEEREPVVPSQDPIQSLRDIIRNGTRQGQKKKFPPSEQYNTPRNYELFIDLVYKMLAYEPAERIKPDEATNHPFIVSMESMPAHEQQQMQETQSDYAGHLAATAAPR